MITVHEHEFETKDDYKYVYLYLGCQRVKNEIECEFIANDGSVTMKRFEIRNPVWVQYEGFRYEMIFA